MRVHAFHLVLGLLLAGLCAAPSAHALNIPGVGEKTKKERRRKEAKTEEAAPAEAKTEVTAPAETKKEEAAAEEAPAAAPAGEVQKTEVTITKEAFEAYKDVKKGTFVEYAYPAMPNSKMRYECVEKTADSITILSTTDMAGTVQKGEAKYVVKDESAKVEAAGRSFDCTVSETKVGGVSSGKTYYSKQVPALMGGLVKTEDAGGKPSMVLTSYGE
ncbi:MAG: hypothetical protein L6R28_06765 [Planctomycetes bacterium]|nr:hypothetical protein [Planctomycetota bacterium]